MHSTFFRGHSLGAVLFFFITSSAPSAFAQSLGNAGTVEGSVVDPSGAAIPKANVTIRNPVSGYSQTASTNSDGSFRLTNIPPNPYHVEISAPGFSMFDQDVDVRNAVPIQIKASLALAGSQTTVNVDATGADILENDPSAHVDVDRTLLLKLPTVDPAAGLSQTIIDRH
jgi:uncharacterized membrane protein